MGFVLRRHTYDAPIVKLNSAKDYDKIAQALLRSTVGSSRVPVTGMTLLQHLKCPCCGANLSSASGECEYCGAVLSATPGLSPVSPDSRPSLQSEEMNRKNRYGSGRAMVFLGYIFVFLTIVFALGGAGWTIAPAFLFISTAFIVLGLGLQMDNAP